MKYSREIVKAVLIGIVIFAILQGVNIVITRSLPSLLSLKWNFIFTMLYSVVLYFANALIFIQLDKHFEKTYSEQEEFLKKIVVMNKRSRELDLEIFKNQSNE